MMSHQKQPHVIGGLASLFLWVFGLVVGIHSVTAAPTLTEISELVKHLKGDDNRLFRWDASETTYALQKDSCSHLADVAQLLSADDDSITDTSSNELLIAAADYILLCITDNPSNREIFSHAPNVQKAVVDKLVKSDDEAVSAIGAHLVYIGVYTNAKNHRAFFEGGAVEALGEIVMNEDACRFWRKIASLFSFFIQGSHVCHSDSDPYSPQFLSGKCMPLLHYKIWRHPIVIHLMMELAIGNGLPNPQTFN